MGREVLDILVKSKRMNRNRLSDVRSICVCLILASILFSCSSLRKTSNPSKKMLSQVKVDPLSFEQRRKFDYYFHEAVRLKEMGEMDAAFDMYSHCLGIDPHSAVTLFELGIEHPCFSVKQIRIIGVPA